MMRPGRFALAFAPLVAGIGWWLLGSGEESRPPAESAPPAEQPTQNSPVVDAGVPRPAADGPAVGQAPAVAAHAPASGAVAALDERLAANGAGVRFTVVDEAGNPVAGAEIVAVAGERDLAAARTDVAGAAIVGVAPPFAWRARAVGYWPVRGTADGERTRVALPPAPRLLGRVFDAAGAPVARARVVLLPPVAGRACAPAALPDDTPEAATAADGRFALPWPDAEPRDLVVDAAGFAPCVVAALRATDVGAPPVNVRLERPARVEGTVRLASGGPFAGARVEVWTPGPQQEPRGATLGPAWPWAGGQLLATADTAADGGFAIGGLPGGRLVVALAAACGGSWEPVVLAPGGAVPIVLIAPRPAAIRGRTARSGDEVFAYCGAQCVRTARPALDGSFALAGLPPGRYLVGAAPAPIAATLHAVVQEYLVRGAPAGVLVVELGAGEERDVALPVPQPLTGAVRGTASLGGLPVGGCVVALDAVVGAGALRREATVGADGTFTIEAVPPGDYDVRLRRRGEAAVVAETRCRVIAGTAVAITLERR